MKRSELREKMMSTIYCYIIRFNNNISFDPFEIITEIFQENLEDIDTYAKDIYLQFLKHNKEIVNKVEPNLTAWTFDRLNTVAQAIFYLALSENYIKETPKKVIINESVAIAKKYIPNDDFKYINAVLDKVLDD